MKTDFRELQQSFVEMELGLRILPPANPLKILLLSKVKKISNAFLMMIEM